VFKVIKKIFGNIKLRSNGCKEFSVAIDIIKKHCNSINDFNEKLDFLEYTVSALKTDLISSYRVKQFYQEHPAQSVYLLPIMTELIIGKTEVNLNKTSVFSIPWKLSSISGLLKVLKERPFKMDKLNHFTTYYPYMDICHVHNGIHSVTIGGYYKNGIIESDLYDIETAFQIFTTDGENWYSSETRQFIQEVFDYRISIIFEVCKIIYKMKKQA